MLRHTVKCSPHLTSTMKMLFSLKNITLLGSGKHNLFECPSSPNTFNPHVYTYPSIDTPAFKNKHSNIAQFQIIFYVMVVSLRYFSEHKRMINWTEWGVCQQREHQLVVFLKDVFLFIFLERNNISPLQNLSAFQQKKHTPSNTHSLRLTQRENIRAV